MSKYITLLTISLLLTCLSWAQQVTKVSGKVLDEETSSPLVGASITVEGIKKGYLTDVEGRFFIALENGKTYNITITNVGYLPKKIAAMQVSTDNNTIDVVLQRNSKSQLQEVVVKGSAKKETIASIYSIQKNSASISDGISAEIIKKSPDRNTSEVLKRVSGASVQENKFVIIRGLNERYNTAMLNNSILPSTEPDRKAFSFDIIPASLIDNLVIYKSSTPDLPGDFSGGAIKIATKDYPSKRLSELSVNIGYNSKTTFKNFYTGFPKGKYDALGFFDDSRLIPAPYYNRGGSFINEKPEFKREVTKMFSNTFGYEPANQSLPNISVSYMGGNTKILGDNKKLGYIYSVGYANGRRVSERQRDDYQIDKVFLYGYNTNNYDVRNNLAALLNLTYSYGKSKISFKNLFNNDFVNTSALRSGRNEVNGASNFFDIKSVNTEPANNGIFNSVLEGTHKLHQDWTLDWNASYGLTYRNQPDQKILTYRSEDNSHDNFYLKLNYENSPEIRNAGRVYSFLHENILGANANLTKEFRLWNQSQKFKIGTANYYRDRSSEANALGYASLDMYGVQIYEGKNTSFNNIFSPENIDAYNLTVANIATNTVQYTGQAMLNAGYVMLDNKFNDKLRLTWGARVENYQQTLSSKNKADIKLNNLDVLPSFILTYALNNRTNLRLAASQAVNRPEFRELASYSVYDYDNNLSIIGNDKLVRSKNTNADLRYEWFPAAGEIFSVSTFYKFFDKPIEQTNRGNDVLSYANATNSKVYGAELEIRKKLDFFGNRFMEHFAFYVNAAYMKGSVKIDTVAINSPMQGQSPYLINTGINYTSFNDNFSVNVLYNRIGPRLRFRAMSGAAMNIFEKPRDVIDLQIAQKFYHQKLEVKFTVSDLLAQPFAWYYKFDSNTSNINYKASDDRIITSFKYGTTAILGLKYNFGK
ncbi:TonB-dependent receptor [Pinibacter aurantiacus]|uniref:TonB-dependent receptor n=1 Tax=Pinibacter aurantiacus TaxID=2851599 RepID=A0A9E2W8E9_9BACT|nr:TonB-dependent receptor [Pinibacter aurantiacus]MBV4358067.1 TonB-dependent receptor [Pinibacter aurantiacus]